MTSKYSYKGITLNNYIDSVTDDILVSTNFNFGISKGASVFKGGIINETPIKTGYSYKGTDVANMCIAKFSDYTGTSSITIPTWCNKVRAVLIGAGGQGAPAQVTPGNLNPTTYNPTIPGNTNPYVAAQPGPNYNTGNLAQTGNPAQGGNIAQPEIPAQAGGSPGHPEIPGNPPNYNPAGPDIPGQPANYNPETYEYEYGNPTVNQVPDTFQSRGYTWHIAQPQVIEPTSDGFVYLYTRVIPGNIIQAGNNPQPGKPATVAQAGNNPQAATNPQSSNSVVPANYNPVVEAQPGPNYNPGTLAQTGSSEQPSTVNPTTGHNVLQEAFYNPTNYAAGGGGGGGAFYYVNTVDVTNTRNINLSISTNNTTLTISNLSYQAVSGSGGSGSSSGAGGGQSSGNYYAGSSGSGTTGGSSAISSHTNSNTISAYGTGGSGGAAPTSGTYANPGSAGGGGYCRIYFLSN